MSYNYAPVMNHVSARTVVHLTHLQTLSSKST